MDFKKPWAFKSASACHVIDLNLMLSIELSGVLAVPGQ